MGYKDPSGLKPEKEKGNKVQNMDWSEIHAEEEAKLLFEKCEKEWQEMKMETMNWFYHAGYVDLGLNNTEQGRFDYVMGRINRGSSVKGGSSGGGRSGNSGGDRGVSSRLGKRC